MSEPNGPECHIHGRAYVRRVDPFEPGDNYTAAFWIADGWLCMGCKTLYERSPELRAAPGEQASG